MSLADCDSNADVIKKYKISASDTGSPEVQVALLTSRLETMTKHFEKHVNDIHSQRGMLRLISRRKRLLAYLKNESPERYKTLIGSLGLRK